MMHIARLTKKRPYRWKVEPAKALEDARDARSGVLFLGPASAENAHRYADWLNEGLTPKRARAAEDSAESTDPEDGQRQIVAPELTGIQPVQP
jgi:hypothetical protein